MLSGCLDPLGQACPEKATISRPVDAECSWLRLGCARVREQASECSLLHEYYFLYDTQNAGTTNTLMELEMMWNTVFVAILLASC